LNSQFYLIIRPEKISWLRFILEGYDGLAIATTIDVRKGLVRIMTTRAQYVESMELIAALSPDLAPDIFHQEY
jgi:hypothetical protein